MKTKTNVIVLTTFILTSLTSAIPGELSKSNETLLDASSPFEDMVEFALAKNDEGIKHSLAEADRTTAAIHGALPKEATEQFDTLLRLIHTAAAAKQHSAVATHCVETFHLFIENLDPESLSVPREISLLDYAGFRLHTVTAAPEPDWNAVRTTVHDAETWWTAIKSKVSNTGLRDAFESTIRGLKQGAMLEHLPVIDFAAQMDLDLVDLLEEYFESRR